MLTEDYQPLRFDFTNLTVRDELIIEEYIETIEEDDNYPDARLRRKFIRVMSRLCSEDLFSYLADEIGDIMGDFYDQYTGYWESKREMNILLSSLIDENNKKEED